MSVFIANQIIKQANVSMANGKAKYHAYFISTRLYESYREAANAILEAEGYADVISAD